MTTDNDVAAFIEFMQEMGYPDPPWHQKEMCRHLMNHEKRSIFPDVERPVTFFRPRRNALPLVPGVRYICPRATLEDYRERARDAGLELVEVPSPQSERTAAFDLEPRSDG